MASATGAGQVVLQYCRGLLRDGWNVTLVCGPPPLGEGDGCVGELRTLGVNVQLLDRTVAPTWPVWKQLVALARDVNPSVIVGIGQRDRAIAMALAGSLGVPGIVTAQNQHVFWGSLLVRIAKRTIYILALRRWASMIICTSEPVRREILGFGIPENRTVLLPNGVALRDPPALTEGHRRSLRAEMGAAPGDILLLNVGRLDIQKGQDILIDSFVRSARERPSLRLAVVGDVSGGPNRRRMEAFANTVRQRAKASSASDRICFLGWRTDVPHLLAAADGYVHSSRWEGLSFAVLEAMCAGLPPVMTDCSGTPVGFEDGVHGWIVPRGNATALARGIANLADLSSRKRTLMGQAARKLVDDNYDVDKIGIRFSELVGTTLDLSR
jgi:glycosyltransferase involved in cell wall biosynthesis